MRHTLEAKFEPGAVDKKGKPSPSLVITGTLLPASELEHEQLAALLDETDVPEASVEFKNVNNVLQVSVKFTHDRDIAKAGHANLRLRHEARDRGMTIEDVKADHEAKAKAAEEAEKAAKK